MMRAEFFRAETLLSIIQEQETETELINNWGPDVFFLRNCKERNRKAFETKHVNVVKN